MTITSAPAKARQGSGGIRAGDEDSVGVLGAARAAADPLAADDRNASEFTP